MTLRAVSKSKHEGFYKCQHPSGRYSPQTWLTVRGETEIFCSSEPVVSFCGSSIVLQCHLEPQQDATDNTVKWTQQSDVVHIRKGEKDVPGEQMERFEGRTSLFSEGLHKGNLSLQLSSLKPSDSGRYKCSFQVGSVEKSCYVNLTVGSLK
ncbi:butyrophilin-like protein 2 [Melanotaenia boesemani]|uniref:butyrophilin-like protein 2 n=1 Tax=Melanotaenia boesemani TaxID=1250792 RepID=UPI001C04B030|nr:butyrophilin-like protein 2 [Melanotaenia boesemani]